MKKLPVILIALLSVLTFSCQPDSMESSAIVGADVELSKRSGVNSIEIAPEESGYYVTRGEDVIGFIFVDFEAGFIGAMGLSLADYCDFSTGLTLQSIPTQQVDIASDPLRQQIIQKGEAYFEFYTLTNEPLCDRIQVAPKLASGYASTVLTDNDLVIYEREDPKNRNAFGFTAKGTLTDPDGNPVSMKVNYRNSWDGVDPATFNNIVKIHLN